MYKKAKIIFKIIFTIIMFVLNICYVAKPCIEKYLDEGVMIEVDNISPESLDPPAITFATLAGPYEEGG